MPIVDFDLKDVVGDTFVSRVGRVLFWLNDPSIVAVGAYKGRLLPTSQAEVIPTSTGKCTVDLNSTTSLGVDTYYKMRIEWNESTMPAKDYPDWQIRLGAGGGSLDELITTTGGSGGPNLSLVLIGLTEPPNLAPGQLWWETSALDPEGPKNTGRIHLGV